MYLSRLAVGEISVSHVFSASYKCTDKEVKTNQFRSVSLCIQTHKHTYRVQRPPGWIDRRRYWDTEKYRLDRDEFHTHCTDTHPTLAHRNNGK